MTRPRWRKVFSDLWDNKLRTALVVFSIAVGVFAVGMIAGAYVIISNDMNQSYAASNPANIEIRTDPFDDDLVSTIQSIPGVKTAQGRRYVSVRASTGQNRWTSLDLVAIPEFAQNKINLLLPIQGESVPPKKQVLLEKDGLNKIPAKVGDILQIQLIDGTIKDIQVAGIVQDQSTGAGDFLASPLGYITVDSLEWLRQPIQYNRLLVTVSGNPNDKVYIQQVSQLISDKLEKSGRQVYRIGIARTNEHPMKSTVQAILGVLGALGVLIVFLSSSLIANTLNALLNQHLRHIGVMKLVGARRSQIFGMYIVLILAFGLIALVIAIPTGGQAAYALAQLIADQMNFNLLGYRVIPAAVLGQALIALVVPLGAGFLPVNTGSRTTVQRAISGVAAEPIQARPGRIDMIIHRLTSHQKLWISRPLLISLRNTFRRKGRLALTLFTLTMAGAIFIAVFNVRISLNHYIKSIGNYFLADVVLNFDRLYRLDEVRQAAMQIPGVQDVEGWAFTSAEVLRPDKTVALNLQILAPPAASQLVTPILLAGRWLQPGDEKAIAVSESILDTYPDLKPGQTLRLKIAGEEDDWKVVGIFKFVGIQSQISYANYEYISELLNQTNQSFTYRIVTDQHQEAYQKQMKATIEQHFRAQGFHVTDVESGSATLETASEGLDTLVLFLLIMALLTATVGSMGLAGTMGMNVLERTREIGVMRSIGAVDREIIKTVIVEGVLIGMISWLLGALLSFPISMLLSTIISLAIFETPIALSFTLEGFAIWLALVLVLSALASVLPAHNAARLTIREVLAYE